VRDGEQHGDGGLVVGAEDRAVGVLPAVVDDDRLDRRVAVRDRVEVRAQQDVRGERPGMRTSRLPHSRPASCAAPSSVTVRPRPRSSAATRSAHGALAAERARDRAQLGEERVEALALGRLAARTWR
jgi:hypothetical protein